MKNRSCPICLSPAIDLRYKRNFYSPGSDPYLISADLSGQCHDLFECRDCRHAFVDDQAFIETVIRSYPDQPIDENYLSEARGRLKTAHKYLRQLEKLLGYPGKILDIGCYTGFFLSAAAERGWRTAGVENSGAAVRLARQQYHLDDIIHGDIETAVDQLADQAYDVVTMFDVIEHLRNPSEIVARVAETIRPGGLLLISTPDITSIMSRLQKQNWYAVLPSHIHLFSRTSLFHLLRERGLQIRSIGTLTRFFSLEYMLSRSYGAKRLGLDKVIRRSFLKDWILPYNVADQMVVVAGK